jgi:2-keto-4-pentenoate hydratase/2-oxohepta-3-ene-1,7-dioic acid hydratase in catechol pathway
MRLGTVGVGGEARPALVTDAGAVVIADAATEVDELLIVPDVLTLITEWALYEKAVRELAASLPSIVADGDVAVHPVESLLAPLRPGKIIAVGRNYAEHIAETGSKAPPEPLLFAKYPTSVVGPFDDVVRPSFVPDLDYEAELAVVIGRRGRDISEVDALDFVLGYCCANDVSARTAQNATGQFVRGKSFDTFCPLGPVIVTRDEVGDVQDLAIRCRVDGDVRQDSNTSQMIFSVRTIIAHCSAATTLEPGDVILTGTPSGVALGQDPPRWLEPGQLCEVEIDGIGRLANRIVAG